METECPINMKIPGARLHIVSNKLTYFQRTLHLLLVTCACNIMPTYIPTDGRARKWAHKHTDRRTRRFHSTYITPYLSNHHHHHQTSFEVGIEKKNNVICSDCFLHIYSLSNNFCFVQRKNFCIQNKRNIR